MWTVYITDRTAGFVQSDLDLHCPQKHLMSSSKGLTHYQTTNFSFSHCFQKARFPEASKGVIVWEWVKQSWRTLRKAYFSFFLAMFSIIYLHVLDLKSTSPKYVKWEKVHIFPNDKFLGLNLKHLHTTK